MTNEQIISKLNDLGEILNQLGEQNVVVGYFGADECLTTDRFTARVSLPGTHGITAIGSTLAGAFFNALADRSAKEAEMAEEEEIRREVEARRAQRRAA